MQPGQVDKIKQLVQISPILTGLERSEWLELIELMNDKQLLELQKILQSATEDQNSGAKLAVPKADPGGPAPQAKPDNGKKPRQDELKGKYGLGFSHIMNFPKMSDSHKREALAKKVAGIKTQASAAVSPPQPGRDGLFSRLKNALSEKELPAGRQDIPLELPAPSLKEQPKTSPISEKPKVTAGEPATVHAGAPAERSSPAPAAVKPARIVTPPVSAGKFVPGVRLPKIPKGTQSGDLPFSGLKPSAAIEQASGGILNIPLGSLKDVSALSLENLRAFNFNSLVKKLQEMIRSFGLHEVVFSLEQSPLFKTYVKTGVAALSGQDGFEELAENGGESFLTREEFELFTDLLRKIKAG